MRWRLILEEYSTEPIYIQRYKNITADALSRVDIVDTNDPFKPNISSLAEYFSLKLFHTQVNIKLLSDKTKQ